jgi:hypothetical protein
MGKIIMWTSSNTNTWASTYAHVHQEWLQVKQYCKISNTARLKQIINIEISCWFQTRFQTIDTCIVPVPMVDSKCSTNCYSNFEIVLDLPPNEPNLGRRLQMTLIRVLNHTEWILLPKPDKSNKLSGLLFRFYNNAYRITCLREQIYFTNNMFKHWLGISPSDGNSCYVIPDSHSSFLAEDGRRLIIVNDVSDNILPPLILDHQCLARINWMVIDTDSIRVLASKQDRLRNPN